MKTKLTLVFTLILLLSRPFPGLAVTSDPPGPPGYIDLDAIRGIFVIQPDSPGIRNLFLNDPNISGVDIPVAWSSIDRGPGASPQYDWSELLEYAQPWIDAGKKVNLIVSSVAEVPGEEINGRSFCPQYVLNQVDKVSVPNLPVTPVFWEPGFIDNYEKFMRAVVQEFGYKPWIGYIRFGIGVEGEDAPQTSFDQPPQSYQWSAYGLTEQKWIQYSLKVVDFEGSLHSPKQLMITLSQYGDNFDLPDAVAAEAVNYGIGLGMQGLSQNELDKQKQGRNGYGDWLNLFQLYAGRVPLEVQTYGPSNPDGGQPVGSLAQLLPFALAQNAQIFELYPQDVRVADDPSSAAYYQYHTAYTEALRSVADDLAGGDPNSDSQVATLKQILWKAEQNGDRDLLDRTYQALSLLYHQAVEDTRLRVFADGREVQSDVLPVMVDARTMVPVRALADALGISDHDILWNALTRTVTITSGPVSMVLPAGSRQVTVNGTPQTIDVPVLIVGNRALVPLRFVTDNFGKSVTWYPVGQLVAIE